MYSAAMTEHFRHDGVAAFSGTWPADCDAPTVIVSFDVYLTEALDHWGHQLVDCTLATQLWSTAQTRTSTDVQLQVGCDAKFFAHRAILAARSAVFARMLDANRLKLSESQPDGVLVVEDVDAVVFEELLYFIYTGQLRTSAHSGQLLAAAQQYEIETLVDVCRAAVESEANIGDVFDTLLVMA